MTMTTAPTTDEQVRELRMDCSYRSGVSERASVLHHEPRDDPSARQPKRHRIRRADAVHAVLPGPVDTDMMRGSDIPKASPESVARAIFDAVDNGEEEIFPDPASAPIAAQ